MNKRRVSDVQRGFRIERRRPSRGYRHLVTTDQLRRFFGLLPEEATWHLEQGLDRFIFGGGHPTVFGWYRDGSAASSWVDLQRSSWADRIGHVGTRRPHCEMEQRRRQIGLARLNRQGSGVVSERGPR